MKIKLFVLATLLAIGGSLFGQGTPVKNIYGSGAPNANLASVVGTTYVDQSTSPATVYTCTAVVQTATLSQCTWTAGGSGSGTSATSIGPVINVTNTANAGCPGTTDWSACFASVTTAAVAAAKVSTGVPTIRQVVTTVQATSAIASATAAVNISAGDTVLVGIMYATGTAITFTVTDPGGNVYAMNNMTSIQASNTVDVAMFSTAAGAAKAASGTMTVSASPSTIFGFIVLDTFNVGSFGQRNILNNATGTAVPTNALPTPTATQDNNNIIVSFLEYCGGGATTLSQTTGTLQASWNGTAVICGGGLVTNTSATPSAGLTTSATISAIEPWAMSTIELRSVSVTHPTVYFPVGTYTYTSGLNFTQPVTLKGEPGSILCYQGTAHAIDLGPSGLTSTNFQGSDYYVIDSLGFQCGGLMTEGIFMNNWVLFVKLLNNQFLNFGNPTAAGVWANGNQNDLFMTGNSFIINDGATPSGFPGTTGVLRQWVNMTTNSAASTLRMENNSAVCISGQFGFVGCNGVFGTSLPMISALGITHIIKGNNFMGGFCPAIALQNADRDTKIEANHFESQNNGCYVISFQSNVLGLRVVNNFFSVPSAGAVSPIGPASGSDTLANAEISNNQISRLPAATPVVTLNNLVGQTANMAWHNTCSIAFAGAPGAPCPLTHTTGGNINRWNNDYSPVLTFAAATTASYTFGTTYAAAPVCVITPVSPGATTFTITTLNTTTLTVTASGSFTGTVNASCNPDAQ